MSTGAALDMTLDDLIKNNKKSSRRGVGGRGRASSSSGPSRRFPYHSGNRASPYAANAKAMIANPGGGGAISVETGTKLYVSNLNYGVSNEDIKELFLEVGDLKRHSVHYDRSGRSKGTAEVVFSRQQDALSAVKKYNNMQLDGKPMKIEIVGTNIGNLAMPPFRNFNGVPSGQGRGGALRRTCSSGGRGFGRGLGRGRDRGEKVSPEDLDAELEKYHLEAMQIN